MTRATCRIVLAAAMLLLAADVFADEPLVPPAPPATVPALPAPATQPVAQIQKWFDDLASSEPGTRDAARVGLLGLGRADLEPLREVVRKSAPLAPAQSTVLHDIVTHIYLAGDPEERTAHGFLGARLEPPEAGVFEGQDVSGGAGVFIYECMPGFCGYRWLRPGDIVSGITLEAEMLRINAKEQLIAAVSSLPPGTPLRLRVLRQGREVEVSLRLDARPEVASDRFKVADWITRRTNEAEEYWTRNFLPLVGGMT